MTSQSRLFRLGRLVLAFALLSVGAAAVHAALPAYLKTPEPSFAWNLKEKIEVPASPVTPAGTVYDMHLTSQVWHDITWTHQLQVFQPKEVEPNALMLLYVTGGKSNPTTLLTGML